MRERTLNSEKFSEMIHGEFASGRGISLVVTGTSMGPLLRHLRDKVVLVKPENEYKPRKGDVVLFHRTDGKYVMHRIVGCVGEHEYIINGDAQSWTERIRGDQIDAVAAVFVRKGRCFSRENNLYRLYTLIWDFSLPFRMYIFKTVDAIKSRIQRDKKND